MGLQRKEMVVALALVADELVRVDPANLKELLDMNAFDLDKKAKPAAKKKK